jgi:hypothetical protein
MPAWKKFKNCVVNKAVLFLNNDGKRESREGWLKLLWSIYAGIIRIFYREEGILTKSF